MTTYEAGDEVEVYDGDIPGWVPGVVYNATSDPKLGAFIAIRTERFMPPPDEELRMVYFVRELDVSTLVRLVNER